ncbi:hypothetical protein C2S52_002707 [Perilla frutescens var. hirtella]|nr:hypothetical protein C2S52_002707 [Perilla frutescens var. hirtella]
MAPAVGQNPTTMERTNPNATMGQIPRADRLGNPIRQMTSAEMREKRAKGMCFNCDQKWSINHKCGSRMMLLVGEEEESDEIEIDSPSEEIILGDISSLNSLSGAGNPRSLRMWGRAENCSVHVLIDSGSTHNFIQPNVAEKLGIKTETISPFRVYIGNAIQGPDIVLGVPWLQDLVQVSHDYRNISMEFKWNMKKVKLQGDENLESRKVTFSQLQAIVDREEVQEMYELTWRHESESSNLKASEERV